jgi:hypothetical protein
MINKSSFGSEDISAGMVSNILEKSFIFGLSPFQAAIRSGNIELLQYYLKLLPKEVKTI